MEYKEFDIIGYCNNIPVIYCPKFIKDSGLGIACASLFSTTDGISHGIGVDDSYFNLPGELKDFFIYHEVGHITNGDISMNNASMAADAMKVRMEGKVHDIELNADKYAFDRIVETYGLNKAIDSIDSLRNAADIGLTMAVTDIDIAGCHELKARMDILKTTTTTRYKGELS